MGLYGESVGYIPQDFLLYYTGRERRLPSSRIVNADSGRYFRAGIRVAATGRISNRSPVHATLVMHASPAV